MDFQTGFCLKKGTFSNLTLRAQATAQPGTVLTWGETSLAKALDSVPQRQPQPRLLGPAGRHLAHDVERQVEHGRRAAQPRGQEGRRVEGRRLVRGRCCGRVLHRRAAVLDIRVVV